MATVIDTKTRHAWTVGKHTATVVKQSDGFEQARCSCGWIGKHRWLDAVCNAQSHAIFADGLDNAKPMEAPETVAPMLHIVSGPPECGFSFCGLSYQGELHWLPTTEEDAWDRMVPSCGGCYAELHKRTDEVYGRLGDQYR